MNKQQLVDFIQDYLSGLMGIPAAEIGTDVPLEHFGMDSTATVGLSGELSERIGVELSPNVAYDYPTIDAIADHALSLTGAAA